MNVQHTSASATPQAVYVSTMGEIIAPVANTISNMISSLVDHVISWTSKRRQADAPKASTAPAPHVSLVMVPGNFVTDAFLRR